MRKISATAAALLLLAAVPTSSTAQVESLPLTAGRTADGAVYFLPKTVLRFHLLVEKKTYTPGQFAKYAEKYMRISGVEQDVQTTYGIADYSVTQLGVRDTSKCYTVKLKGGKCETAELHFSSDGVLQSVNTEPIAPIERKPFRAAPSAKAADPRQYLSAEVQSAASVAKKAELTVQQLQELQESRQQLITGDADEVPQDEHLLHLMLSEIDKEREALMSLFTGTVQRDTTEHVITVCPTGASGSEVLFRLSQKLGVVAADDLSGIPFYISIENLYPATFPTPENKKHEGFYVNVPGVGRITLFQEDKQLASFDMPIAQFGFATLRDGAVFKRYVTRMRLNPATGAVEMMQSDVVK